MDDIDLAMDVLSSLSATRLWRLDDDRVLVQVAGGFWRMAPEELYERALAALAMHPETETGRELDALFRELIRLERGQDESSAVAARDGR